MAIRLKLHAVGLLNYAKEGRKAVTRIKKAMNRVLNVGRKEARRRISSEFEVQTGFLRRQARRMRNDVSVKGYEIKGRITPIPKLMNIFERGATLAQGRGVLRPRQVVAPSQRAMDAMAHDELAKVLDEVGK